MEKRCCFMFNYRVQDAPSFPDFGHLLSKKIQKLQDLYTCKSVRNLESNVFCVNNVGNEKINDFSQLQ